MIFIMEGEMVLDQALMVKLGRLFREKREQLGYTQKDLADDFVSVATISYFETGRRKIGEKKMTYLFRKVNLDYHDVLKSITCSDKHSKRETELRLRLQVIEQDLDSGCKSEALKELKELKLPMNHPYSAVVEYLKGKYHFKEEQWKKAQKCFDQAIYLYDTYPEELEGTNIKAASLYTLGVISYRQSDFKQAYDYATKGLEEVGECCERRSCKYALMVSQVIYLEKMDRDSEAMLILERMWSCLDQIQNSDIILNMYEMQATFHIKQKMYEKAITCIEKAIEIARQEKNYNRSFELWTALARVYKYIREFNLAKICFQTASKIEPKIDDKFLSAYNYKELGLLYLQEGEYELAQTILEKAVIRSKKVKDALQLCESLIAYGDCFLKQKKNKKAIRQYEEAYEICKQYGFYLQEKNLTLKLAKYYEFRNLIKHEKYLKLFYKASIKLFDYASVSDGNPHFTPKLHLLEQRDMYVVEGFIDTNGVNILQTNLTEDVKI